MVDEAAQRGRLEETSEGPGGKFVVADRKRLVDSRATPGEPRMGGGVRGGGRSPLGSRRRARRGQGSRPRLRT